MFYYFELIIVAYIITIIGKAILSKKDFELSNIDTLYYFCVLFVSSGIAIRTYIYLEKSGDYFFMDLDAHRKIRVICAACIIDIFLFAIMSMIHIALKSRDGECIFEIWGRKILPLISIKYFIAICAILYSILAMADSLMPQYGYWKIENRNINYSSTYVHDNVSQNYSERQYPLVSELSEIGEDDKVILVIGDSFIWGDGSSNINNMWWRALQNRIINEGYSDCKIVAVGMCGASTQNQLDWIENTSMISDIHPDMIIFGYVTNDAEYVDENGNMIPDQWTPSSYISTSCVMRFASFIFPNIAAKIDNDLQAREIRITDLSSINKYYYDEWEREIINESNLQRYYDKTLKPLSEEMQQLGIEYCFITTPNTPSGEKFESLYDKVIPKFEEAGITIYNSLPDFVENCSNSSEYYKGINPVNAHPGIATNVYIADYAFDVLKHNYCDILGEQENESEIVRSANINDWYPCGRLDPKQYDGTSIDFSYSDSWEPDNYLYLPGRKKSIKMCFDHPIDLYNKKIEIYDENGQGVDYLRIKVTYLDENGCEVMDDKPIKGESGIYECNCLDVTSLNIGGSTDGKEHRYTLKIINQ